MSKSKKTNMNTWIGRDPAEFMTHVHSESCASLALACPPIRGISRGNNENGKYRQPTAIQSSFSLALPGGTGPPSASLIAKEIEGSQVGPGSAASLVLVGD